MSVGKISIRRFPICWKPSSDVSSIIGSEIRNVFYNKPPFYLFQIKKRSVPDWLLSMRMVSFVICRQIICRYSGNSLPFVNLFSGICDIREKPNFRRIEYLRECGGELGNMVNERGVFFEYRHPVSATTVFIAMTTVFIAMTTVFIAMTTVFIAPSCRVHPIRRRSSWR